MCNLDSRITVSERSLCSSSRTTRIHRNKDYGSQKVQRETESENLYFRTSLTFELILLHLKTHQQRAIIANRSRIGRPAPVPFSKSVEFSVSFRLFSFQVFHPLHSNVCEIAWRFVLTQKQNPNIWTRDFGISDWLREKSQNLDRISR